MKKNYLKKSFLILSVLSLFAFASCEDEPTDPCDSSNPMKDISWLKDLAKQQETNFKYPLTICRCSYNEQKGFLLVSEIGDGKKLSEFYNCSGELICQSGGTNDVETCPGFSEQAVMGQQIYVKK